MRKILLSLAIAGSIGLTGCSIPVNEDNLAYVETHAYAEKTDEAKAAITIHRDGGIMGFGVNLEISIDDKLVAEIPNGHAARFYLKPGTYRITAHLPMQTFTQVIDVYDRDMTYRFFSSMLSGCHFERIR